MVGFIQNVPCLYSLSIQVDVVKGLLAKGKTYSQISAYLKQQYPREFSERSARRFVKENDLKEKVNSDTVEAVKQSVCVATL